MLATVIAGLVLGAVDSFINVLAVGYAYGPFSNIFYLAILLPNPGGYRPPVARHRQDRVVAIGLAPAGAWEPGSYSL